MNPSIHQASGKPIAKIMTSWTTQMGFPLVEVVGRSTKADGSTTLQLTQKWFLADGSSPDDRLWTIPLTLTTSQSACGAPVLFTERSFSVDVPAGAAWAKLNGMQHVPLRVAYDSAGLSALSAAVAAGQLGAEGECCVRHKKGACESVVCRGHICAVRSIELLSFWTVSAID